MGGPQAAQHLYYTAFCFPRPDVMFYNFLMLLSADMPSCIFAPQVLSYSHKR